MPLFITLEGPDGSGKSTQARLLVDELRRRGFVVLETREPGGTELGECIRDMLFGADAPHASPMAMALLMAAARSELTAAVIRPALQNDYVVVADRYADSTTAYQSYGQGLDREDMEGLIALATGGLKPDVTIYIDIPVELVLERVADRGSHNRLDAEERSFHERVRLGYREIAAHEPERFVYIDGAADPSTVHHEVWRAVAPHLERIARAV